MRKSPEKEQERERVRMTLMRATLDLAEAHGFSSLGLREISREAGIAPTSFYRHFADVEELGLALIQRLVGPRLEEVVLAAQSASGAGGDAVGAVVEGLLDTALDDPALLRFMLAQHSGAHARLRQELRVQFEPLLGVLEGLVSAGAPAGAPASVLAGILLGCDGLLEVPVEQRAGARERSKRPMVAAARWLLRCEGEGDDG